MIYKIVLDCYQARIDDDQYAVSFSGTLASCDAQTSDTGTFWPEPRDRYTRVSSKPKSLSGLSGFIYGLEPASNLVATRPPDAGGERSPRWPGRWTAIVLSLCLGAGAALLLRSKKDGRR